MCLVFFVLSFFYFHFATSVTLYLFRCVICTLFSTTQKPQQLVGSTRMPVFLSRNARHSRKHTVGKISVNIEGNPATLKELQAGDAGEENSPNSSKNAKASDANSSSSSFSSSSTSNGSKQQQSHSNVGGVEGEKQRALNESTSEATGATGGKVKSSQQEESGATTGKGETNPSSSPAAAAAAAALATRDSCGNGGKAASSGNNNNLNNINNNNSICSTNKQLDNPLWFGGSGVKKAPPPERLPCMNGADRNLLYIDDSEQMKVNRTFKTNQVQKKNFTMYRPGALTRARKVGERRLEGELAELML